MYLESILVLSQKGGPVRSLDVARYMGVSKPSVSRAMGILKTGNYVNIDDQGYITLAESGKKIAGLSPREDVLKGAYPATKGMLF